MRGLRSTLVLLVVLLFAGGYAYYISKKPAEDSSSKQEKVFGNIQADGSGSITHQCVATLKSRACVNKIGNPGNRLTWVLVSRHVRALAR